LQNNLLLNKKYCPPKNKSAQPVAIQRFRQSAAMASRVAKQNKTHFIFTCTNKKIYLLLTGLGLDFAWTPDT